jgi:hypothetical protein
MHYETVNCIVSMFAVAWLLNPSAIRDWPMRTLGPSLADGLVPPAACSRGPLTHILLELIPISQNPTRASTLLHKLFKNYSTRYYLTSNIDYDKNWNAAKSVR